MIHTELECIVNQYNYGFINPMMMWGKNRKIEKAIDRPKFHKKSQVPWQKAKLKLFHESNEQAKEAL